jgi:hypothetical protein
MTAALFTGLLGTHGVTGGVGDIHATLYSAYAEHREHPQHATAFRDVTSGRDGRQADVDFSHVAHRTGEFPVNAQPGYDTVTGLGAPLWPQLAPLLFTATNRPIAHAAIAFTRPHRRAQADDVTLSWRGVIAPTHGSAPTSARLVVTKAGRAKPVYRRANAPASGTAQIVAGGGDYTLSVVERDLAGGHSAKVVAHLRVPYPRSNVTSVSRS